ncbi:MAG: DUF2235 domain-containing protein [Pseudomonadota bacterium]
MTDGDEQRGAAGSEGEASDDQTPKRQIVLLADGTGNSASNPHKSNVWRLYTALDRTNDNLRVHYDNGVGTSGFSAYALLGKAFGVGLTRNVLQLYENLCRDYVEDAEIFVFGYSRGAFTVRVLAAFIADHGIIKASKLSEDDLKRAISESWTRFRHENYVPSLFSYPSYLSNKRKAGKSGSNAQSDELSIEYANIKLIGVWDTVDAYGAPIDEIGRAWDVVIYPLSLKDRDLHHRIDYARHALSLDDQRESFSPMLWNEASVTEEPRTDGNRSAQSENPERPKLLQIWFPGVHGNVGGGYPQDHIAMIPLLWMIDEAKDLGLNFIDSQVETYRNSGSSLAPLGDSRSGIGVAYRFHPREIERLNQESPSEWPSKLLKLFGIGARKNVVDNGKAKIHEGVFQHILDGGDGYAPINLPLEYDVYDSAGKQVDWDYEGNGRQDRYKGQQGVWNLVLWRKLIYYINAILVFAFLIYPFTTEESHLPNPQPIFGTMTEAVASIPLAIGSWTGIRLIEEWGRGYANLKGEFLLFALSIGVLLGIGGILKRRAQTKMHALWRHVRGLPPDSKGGQDRTPSDRAESTELVAGTDLRAGVSLGFATSPSFYASREVLRASAQLLAIAVFAYLSFAVVWRIGYLFWDFFGQNPECSNLRQADAEYAPIDACQTRLNLELDADGTELLAGKEYRLGVTAVTADRPTQEGGESNKPGPLCRVLDKLPQWSLTPLRRHTGADWGDVVLRVDNYWFERYPLDITDGAREVFHLRPCQDGELFAYENRLLPFFNSVCRSPNPRSLKVELLSMSESTKACGLD